MSLSIVCLLLLFIFIIGTVIGSFLNVVALRGLTGESIVLPPSKCPHCGNKLKPWHNIPILSYLFLGGKCAFCKEKISIQYPIVETITGILLLGTLLKFTPSITALFVFIACCTLIVMSVTDLREKVICAGHAWFLIIMGIIYNLILSHNLINSQLNTRGYFLYTTHNFMILPITNAIIGLVAGVVIMEILARLGYLFVGKRAFGVGDTFIAAGLGVFFGWKNLLLIIALSIVTQVALVLPGFFKKLAAKKDFATILSIVVFLLAAASFSLAQIYGYMESFTVCVIASIILLIVGLIACIKILKGIKSEGDISVLPFGPAMAIATFIVLFILAV